MLLFIGALTSGISAAAGAADSIGGLFGGGERPCTPEVVSGSAMQRDLENALNANPRAGDELRSALIRAYGSHHCGSQMRREIQTPRGLSMWGAYAATGLTDRKNSAQDERIASTVRRIIGNARRPGESPIDIGSAESEQRERDASEVFARILSDLKETGGTILRETAEGALEGARTTTGGARAGAETGARTRGVAVAGPALLAGVGLLAVLLLRR